MRELEHQIERGILLSEDETLKEIHLPQRRQDGQEGQATPVPARTLQQIERTHIIEGLKRCSGKISGGGGAAEILEIPGTTLHSKMKKLKISKADYFIN